VPTPFFLSFFCCVAVYLQIDRRRPLRCALFPPDLPIHPPSGLCPTLEIGCPCIPRGLRLGYWSFVLACLYLFSMLSSFHPRAFNILVFPIFLFFGQMGFPYFQESAKHLAYWFFDNLSPQYTLPFGQHITPPPELSRIGSRISRVVLHLPSGRSFSCLPPIRDLSSGLFFGGGYPFFSGLIVQTLFPLRY